MGRLPKKWLGEISWEIPPRNPNETDGDIIRSTAMAGHGYYFELVISMGLYKYIDLPLWKNMISQLG